MFSKKPLHLVFKAEIRNLKKGLRSPREFAIVRRVIRKYAKRFHIKIEQLAICRDHIHCLIRLQRRSLAQHFFRVVAGQIAQNFKRESLSVTDTQSIWKHRPFTRVVRGYRDHMRVMMYVRLNELEASGRIPYQVSRTRSLSSRTWEILFDGS